MRVFNALNGTEIKKILLTDVERVLSQDSELMPHLTFPKVSWTITIELRIYPRTPEGKQILVVGEVAQHEPGVAEPIIPPDALGVQETITSERRIDAPDQAREEHMLAVPLASPQIKWARQTEVGKGSENPVVSTGNRD